jgi:hypothetical protein
MFVQVIQGKTDDAAGLRRQSDRWAAELAKGADGWLGSTIGVADDGEFVAIARFRDEAAARKNSERPEQGDWWNETSKYFEGEVRFADCTETDTFRAGGSDEAGFVQIMQGKADMEKLRALDARFEQVVERPDLLGGTRAWHGDGTFTEAAYFTSEADARAGESQEPPPETKAILDEWLGSVQGMRYIDLKDPWLYSP